LSVLAKVYGDHASTVNSIGKYKAYMKVVRAAALTVALIISTIHCTSFGSDLREKAEEKKIEFVLAMLSMFVGLVGINHFCS
jgi:hypothetical protein